MTSGLGARVRRAMPDRAGAWTSRRLPPRTIRRCRGARNGCSGCMRARSRVASARVAFDEPRSCRFRTSRIDEPHQRAASKKPHRASRIEKPAPNSSRPDIRVRSAAFERPAAHRTDCAFATRPRSSAAGRRRRVLRRATNPPRNAACVANGARDARGALSVLPGRARCARTAVLASGRPRIAGGGRRGRLTRKRSPMR